MAISRTIITKSLSCIAILLFNSHYASATALPSFLDPVKGQTVEEEIKCYSIPYGGIGFASHLITYYTLICLWRGKRPLWPWMELEHRIYDCILGITTLIGTIGLATFTIIRCRNRWEFMLIGVWKIFMSAMLSFTSITTAVEPQSRRSVYWSFLYFPGLVTGFVGLCSLVNQDWKEKTVQIISFAFAGTLVLVSVVGVIFLQCLGSDSRTLKRLAKSPLAAGIILFVTGTSVLGALYSDWILGAIGDDLVGFPSGDNQYLYWAYFVAKRLPLLSF